MLKRFLNLLLVAVVVVLLFNLINDSRFFFRKNFVRFSTSNFGYFDKYEVLQGNMIFCAVNVRVPKSSNLSYIKNNFDFVSKGDSIAKAYFETGTEDIKAPVSGYFIRGSVNKEYQTIDDILKDYSSFQYTLFAGDKISFAEWDCVGAIVTDNDFLVQIDKNSYNGDELAIILSDFVVADGKKYFEDEKFVFYHFSDFFSQIFSLINNFKISLGKVYGLKVPKSAIISKGDETYIYIVNGNVIRDVQVKIEQEMQDETVVSILDNNFLGFNALIVVSTPKLFKVGEVVGNF